MGSGTTCITVVCKHSSFENNRLLFLFMLLQRTNFFSGINLAQQTKISVQTGLCVIFALATVCTAHGPNITCCCPGRASPIFLGKFEGLSIKLKIFCPSSELENRKKRENVRFRTVYIMNTLTLFEVNGIASFEGFPVSLEKPSKNASTVLTGSHFSKQIVPVKTVHGM